MKKTFLLFSLLLLIFANSNAQIQYSITDIKSINYESKQGKAFNLNIFSDSGKYKRIRLNLPEEILLIKGEKKEKINKDSNSYTLFVPNAYTKSDFKIEVEQLPYSAASRTFATIWRVGFKYPIALTLSTTCLFVDIFASVYQSALYDEPNFFYFTEQSFYFWQIHRFYKDEIAHYNLTFLNDSANISVPDYLQNREPLKTNIPDSIRAQIKPIKPTMVKVEGGSFYMGDTIGDSNQMPRHKVSLSTFYMSENLISIAEYYNFCLATARETPLVPSWGKNDNKPIVNVNYSDAVAYCNWLSKELNTKFRLPTEAEWEYAARGGNKSRGYVYAGSDILDEIAWYKNNASEQAMLCGLKKPNELGIYDMLGNVFVWCNDWYEKYNSTDVVNPTGPSTGSERVLKGCCWDNNLMDCKITNRFKNPEIGSGDGLGFRIVSVE